MIRVGLYIVLLVVVVSGCAQVGDGACIVKIVDFELSPDENKVAFSALTPVGNTDIWVVEIVPAVAEVLEPVHLSTLGVHPRTDFTQDLG